MFVVLAEGGDGFSRQLLRSVVHRKVGRNS